MIIRDWICKSWFSWLFFASERSSTWLKKHHSLPDIQCDVCPYFYSSLPLKSWQFSCFLEKWGGKRASWVWLGPVFSTDARIFMVQIHYQSEGMTHCPVKVPTLCHFHLTEQTFSLILLGNLEFVTFSAICWQLPLRAFCFLSSLFIHVSINCVALKSTRLL